MVQLLPFAALAVCAAASKPNIVMLLSDDMGWYDTAIYNDKSPTPNIKAACDEGIRLDRHYVFRYCSPTRRALLSGRFPTHITSVQPDGSGFCTDFLPLNFTILSQKMRSAGYETHFVGKGHLGYQTTDHLPINRGFDTHLGYLSGSETYEHGGGSKDVQHGSHDLWENNGPATDVVPRMEYSANTYTDLAVSIIQASKKPLYLHLMYQNVHSPYTSPPEWECGSYPQMWSEVYANMMHMLDSGVGNVTDALKSTGKWENTLMVFSSDNGGIGKANNYPLRGHKHDPWEGGTRVTAFVTGGYVPAHLRGTSSGDKLVHITDWYPTFCNLAGADPTDTVMMAGKLRPIDGVDVWPLLTGANTTQPRPLTPTTEVGIIDTSGTPGKWWKLIVLAGQSNYYSPDQKSIAGNDTCLSGRQPDPPMPGRTDALVTGCPVCNATKPCLYDVLADPHETTNVADQHEDVVARLAAALAAANDLYVGKSLPDSVLAANYTKVDPDSHWKKFLGPCYLRK